MVNQPEAATVMVMLPPEVTMEIAEDEAFVSYQAISGLVDSVPVSL
jgi:hypothetical protein